MLGASAQRRCQRRMGVLQSIADSTCAFQSFLEKDAPQTDSGLHQRLKDALTIGRTTRLEVRVVKVFQKSDWTVKIRNQKCTTYVNEFISQENKPPGFHQTVKALVDNCKKAASKAEEPVKKPTKSNKEKGA